MATFHYQALNHDQQIVTGDIQAETALQAITDLESQGLTVQSLGQSSQETAAELAGALESQPALASTKATAGKPLEVDLGQAVLRSHLTRVLDQGKAIAPALRVYSEELQSRPSRRKMQSLIRVLEGGDVAKATSTFGPLSDYWVPLFGAVAASREPGSVLQEFVERSPKGDEPRNQWATVLAYPIFVACIAVAVVAEISFFVVPIMHEVLEAFDTQLPAATELLLSLTELVRTHWLFLIFAALLATVILVRSVTRGLPNIMTAVLDWLSPLRPARAMLIGKLSHFTADLLAAGLSTPDALRVAGIAVDRPNLHRAASNLASEIDSKSVSPQQSPHHRLTSTLVHAMRSEMTLESRIRVLRQISQCHVQCAQSRRLWSTGTVGPIAIGVIGLFVGWTILALLLPMFQLVVVLS